MNRPMQEEKRNIQLSKIKPQPFKKNTQTVQLWEIQQPQNMWTRSR